MSKAYLYKIYRTSLVQTGLQMLELWWGHMEGNRVICGGEENEKVRVLIYNCIDLLSKTIYFRQNLFRVFNL